MLQLLLFILPFQVLASDDYSAAEKTEAPSAKIEKLVGKADFQGKPLKQGQVLKTNGHLKTGEKSVLKISVGAWKSELVLGANSQMDLDITSPPNKDPKRYQLRDGICRWVSGMKSDKMKGSHVFTKSAAMGIRGTDFWIKHSEATSESEIIVFDGQVLFQSQLEKSEILLHKGQWGGVGGKYGKSVSKPVDVPEEKMKEIRKEFEI